MKSTALAIFVKTPGISPLKTRLKKDLDPQLVDELYQFFCHKIESVAKSCSLDSFWCVSEEQSAQTEDYWGSLPRIYQGQGDLQKKLNSVYNQLKSHYKTIIFIGSDMPHISTKILNDAVSSMNYHNAVFGPAEDGGFYLSCLSNKHPDDIFSGVNYSSDTTLKELSLKLPGNLFLEKSYDIDTITDLKKLIKEYGIDYFPETLRHKLTQLE